MSSWSCAACGRPSSMLGHSDRGGFLCAEGRDNDRARESGKPLQWMKGAFVGHLNLCHICEVPNPCGNDHIVKGVGEVSSPATGDSLRKGESP